MGWLRNPRYVKSSSALFVFILGLGFVFISMPLFFYFVITESLRGSLFWSEAFLAFCICCFGAVLFAAITWLLFDPMRRSSRLNSRKGSENDSNH